MINLKITCLLLFLFFGVASEVRSQESASQKKFSFSTGLYFNSSFHRSDDVNRRRSFTFFFLPLYKFSDRLTFILSQYADKDLRGQKKFSINDTIFGVSSKILDFYHNIFSLSLKGLLELPTSEISRDDEKRFGIRVAPALRLKGSDGIWKRVSGSYELAFQVNSYKFDQSPRTNSFNTQFFMRHLFSVNIIISKNFIELSNSFSYRKNFKYSGGTDTDTYSFSSELQFILPKNFTVGLSHSNGGNPLHPNGQDQDIKIFDSNTSTWSLSFYYTY